MIPFMLALALIAGGQALIATIGMKPCSEIITALDSMENFQEEGRVFTMVFDEHGHSPFNYYEGMSNDGDCIQVTVGLYNRVLNVTVACKGTASSPVDGSMICPTWAGSQQWKASHVTVRRVFEQLTVEGCIPFNETHQIYGSIQVGQQIMTKKKVVSHPGAVEFSEMKQCSCHFRNEFVVDLSDPANEEQGSLKYCYWQWQMQSWVVIYVSSMAVLFSIGLSAYLVIRLALWRIKTSHSYGCEMN